MLLYTVVAHQVSYQLPLFVLMSGLQEMLYSDVPYHAFAGRECYLLLQCRGVEVVMRSGKLVKGNNEAEAQQQDEARVERMI